MPAAPGTEFFGHPRGLATLFFTEMWERFSYYGMRALLILYMTAAASTGGLALPVSEAGAIYGLYTAMVYMAALPGGWVADRIIGWRNAVIAGGVLISFGNFLLALPGLPPFYFGLIFIVAGTGLLKPNVSAIVGQLYGERDQRRDAGFSIFYMGINLGAFIAPLICGYVGQRINWRYGFGLAAIGMAFGVVQFVFGRKHLGEAGLLPPGDRRQEKKRGVAGLVAVVAIVIAVAALSRTGFVGGNDVADASGALLVAVVIAFFGWMFFAAKWTPVERKRLLVVLGLFIASCAFWSVFEQAGSTLNLFADRSSDNKAFGYAFPASWYQSVNAMFIISLAPVFAWLWIRLASKEPSSPAKFAWALGLVGFGFLILSLGANLAQSGIRVSPMWLVATYLLHTMGELCLSPVGLSAMTKLAPASVTGLMMGVWFLSISVGNYVGGRLASLYESLPLPTLFGSVGFFAIIVGIMLAILVRPMVRLMGGVR